MNELENKYIELLLKRCINFEKSKSLFINYQVESEFIEKVVDKAIKNGFIEDKDFFKIIDNGYTEFNNEKTWTCIGFKPMESEKIDKVTKRLRLFKE